MRFWASTVQELILFTILIKLKYNTGEFVIIQSVKSFRLSLITVRFNHVIATLRAVQRPILNLCNMLTYTLFNLNVPP